MKPRLEGIWTPMVTPLDRNGELNVEVARDLVNFLIENGVDGLFPCGTTGEFVLLTAEERNLLVRTVVEEARGRVPVIAGVGDTCMENVIRFAAAAKDAGADAVVATTPFYFTTTEDGIYEYFKHLAEKIELPLLLYNIPEWTHLFAPPSVVSRLAEEQLIVGMKYTEYDFSRLLAFLTELKGKIPVFNGSDALTYTNLEFGGAGGVLGVSNIVPQMTSRLFDEFKRGNLKKAKEIQTKSLPVIRAMSVGQFPAGVKEAMKLLGIDVGGTKPPVLPLNPEEKRRVKGILTEAGILNGSESQ
jgi:4-hydroxy-tetrahydrodipicolinate synthase